MSEFTCLVLSAMVVSITSVYARIVAEASSLQEFNYMIFECAKEHMVSDQKLRIAMEVGDLTSVNPCFWTCCLKKTGFLNDNGRYILESGLNYARKLIKKDDAYTILVNIAIQCALVPDGTFKCEKGLLIAICFAEQLDQIRFFSNNKNVNELLNT